MTYVFDHIFKTGGTSFNLSYLPRAFAAEELLLLHGSREANLEDLQSAMALSVDQRAGLKVVSGHNAGKLRGFYPEARFLTLVREPVARAISSYLHAKYHHDAWEHTGRKIQELGMSLAQYVEANWLEQQHDLQSGIRSAPRLTTTH